MKKKVKIISVILSITVMLSSLILPVTVQAKTYEGHNSQVKYVVKNGTLTVSKYTSAKMAYIPDYSTNNLPAWHKYAKDIKKIVIKDNINKIGSYAFWGLTKATNVTIGKDAEILNTAPFGHCDALTSFTVNSKSTKLTTASSILYNKSKTILMAYPANKNGSSFTIPDSVTTVKGFCFSHAQNLTYITQNSPGHITTINGYIISGAKKMETITVKNNCKTLGNNAFYNSTTLKSVTLPPSITSVGNDLFLPSSKVPKLRIHCSTGSAVFNKLSGKGYILSQQKWNFTCSFNANGGSVSQKSKTIIFNEKYGALPTPTKTGYKFDKWVYNGKTITANTIVTTAASHTLNAQYIANTYNVKINPNGGICGTENLKLTYNQAIGNLPTPTRVGYIFVGWYTTPEGEGEKITTDKIFRNPSITDIYARWLKPNEIVTGLNIKYNTEKSVLLSWNEQDKVTGYEIFAKANDDSYELIKTTGETSCVITLDEKNQYSFKVRSYMKNSDGAYMYGEFSDEVNRDKTYVEQPSVTVNYKKNNGLLTVSWKKISNAKEYIIYQYKSKKWKNVKTTTSTKFYMYTKANKTYKFRVKAYTIILGHKYYSKNTSITFNSKIYIATPKVKCKFIKGKKKISFKWKKVKGAKGYKIYLYKNKKWKTIKTTSKCSYKYKIKKYNKVYKFRIKAYKKVKGKTYYSSPVKIRVRKKKK